MQNQDCGTSAITSNKLAKTDKLYSRDTLWYWNCWGVCIRDAYEMPHAHMYTCNLVGCLISVPDWNDKKLCSFREKQFLSSKKAVSGSAHVKVSFHFLAQYQSKPLEWIFNKQSNIPVGMINTVGSWFERQPPENCSIFNRQPSSTAIFQHPQLLEHRWLTSDQTLRTLRFPSAMQCLGFHQDKFNQV